MKTKSKSFWQTPAAPARAASIELTGLLVLFSIFAVGCRASLERMAHREIEKRPVSKVYLSGMKYFQNLMKQGQVPGVKSPESVVWQPSDDLMTEEEIMEVKYPFRMTVKLKEKGSENVLYSYTLLKQSPTVEWRIVEAWRGQIEIHNKVDLLQSRTDGASGLVTAFGRQQSPGGCRATCAHESVRDAVFGVGFCPSMSHVWDEWPLAGLKKKR